MGKGDHSQPVPSAAETPELPSGTIRSRHQSLSSSGPTNKISITGVAADETLYCAIKPDDESRGSLLNKKISNIQEKDDDKNSTAKVKISKCRGYIILGILLLANLINYMDRYTIAGE